MGPSRDDSSSKSVSRSNSRSRSRSDSLSSSSSGRTAKSRHWNGEGGHRLHLSDLAIGVNRREIEKLFQPYGPLNEIWVASNPPCFAFINFRHRDNAERALRDLDGKVVGGSRIGLTWARPRNYGGRSKYPSRYRSPSPSYRRSHRDSSYSRRSNDRYNKRRYSKSRSRSPYYRRDGHQSRGRISRSPSATAREKRQKTSKYYENERNRFSRSRSNSNGNFREDERSQLKMKKDYRSTNPKMNYQQTILSNDIDDLNESDYQHSDLFG